MRITLVLLFFAGILSLPALLTGQQIDMDLLAGIKPRNLGPAGMSGRVTAIDVDLSDSDIIYAGTASGGVWKSINGGITWKPVFDDQPVQSIGAVAVTQQNPDVIWAGTGEGNPRNSMNSGAGIYKSLDGGETWTLMGLENTKTIHRIIVHRDNPDVVFAATLGSVWGPNTERGVYRTTDGGKTWEKILYINDETGCADLVVDPTNPNKLIAAMWEFGRKPWTFNSGGKGSGIFVTYDGGHTWTRRTDADGLPKGNLGRIGLAIAPSKPNIVYAIVEAGESGFYKSTDGGKTWERLQTRGDFGNRPFYYSDIFVDTKNENRIFSLHSVMTKSEDGGRTWEMLLPYDDVHPDHHAFWIHPDDPSYIIEGNDGGLNISRDGGETWRFNSNIPLAQLYHISYDMDIPYNVAGGMQDNGSWVGPSAVWEQGGITNSHWQEVYFGDGFDVQFKPDDNRYVYAMSQGGNVGLVDRQTGKSTFIRPTHPDEDVELRFNWNAPIALDPFNDCGLYYGSQFVHYSDDCGQSWTILSPDLTTNDTSKQQQAKSGGLTIDNTGAENHTTLLVIAPSPVDRQVIWAGSDDGNLQLTRDGGKTWTNLASRLPNFKAGSWIPFIEVSSKNAGEAFVIGNDYRRNDYRPMAYHTADFGANWTQIADESRVEGHALSIAQDPIEPNLLFLGTDFGLYFSIDGGAGWTKWTKGFPSVSTRDVRIHPRDHDLVIATFGRAAWIIDDIRPLRELARTRGKVLDQPFKVFEAPDAYLAEFKNFLGIRFTTDGEFKGDNRRPDAMITLWRKPPSLMPDAGQEQEGKKKAKTPDRAKVFVVDSQGDTVRTFSTPVDTGMTRIYWDLATDGVRYPSRRQSRPDADPPSGPQALPGVYKLVFQWGAHKDSTNVTVKTDPRLDIDVANLEARMAAYREMEEMVELSAKAFDQLIEAEKTIERVNAAMETAPDTLKKEIAKMGKAVQDSIKAIEKLYSPENRGDATGMELTMLFRSAGRYLQSSEGAPNQAAQRYLDRAEAALEVVLRRVDDFFQNEFREYREQVEQTSFSLFQPYEPVRRN